MTAAALRRITDPEDRRKVEYLVRQLADPNREDEWPFLKGVLASITRRYP